MGAVPGDELPGVAALLVLHQLGGPIVKLLGQVLRPHVGWLDRVTVRRDEPVFASHRTSPVAPPSEGATDDRHRADGVL